MNKRRFLIELGRLITFVPEEDRQHVIKLYNELFDSVTDETILFQILVSPSRQAVELAHTYRAKELRKQTGVLTDTSVEVIEMLDKLRFQAKCQGILNQTCADGNEEQIVEIGQTIGTSYVGMMIMDVYSRGG